MTHHGENGSVAYLVTLAPRRDPAATVLALNTYCHAFLVEPARLGIWCPEHKGDPACAIFALYPRAGLLEVLPQQWFTAKTHDRVSVDHASGAGHVTHRLSGHGIRIGRFELTDDGCQVERWLE